MKPIRWEGALFLTSQKMFEAELSKFPLVGRYISILTNTLIQRGIIGNVDDKNLAHLKWMAQIEAVESNPRAGAKWVFLESYLPEDIGYNWDNPSGILPKIFDDGLILFTRGSRRVLIHPPGEVLDPSAP
jgi:hypothetical protein